MLTQIASNTGLPRSPRIHRIRVSKQRAIRKKSAVDQQKLPRFPQVPPEIRDPITRSVSG